MDVTVHCKVFVIVTLAAVVAGVVLFDEAAAAFPPFQLVVGLVIDAAAAYIEVYLVVGAVLNLLARVETHFDVVLLVLHVLQEISTERVHLTDQL